MLSTRGCPGARLGALACVCCLAPALSRNAEHAAAPAWSQGPASSPPQRGERKTWLQAQPAVRRAIWAETRGAGLRRRLSPLSAPRQGLQAAGTAAAEAARRREMCLEWSRVTRLCAGRSSLMPSGSQTERPWAQGLLPAPMPSFPTGLLGASFSDRSSGVSISMLGGLAQEYLYP